MANFCFTDETGMWVRISAYIHPDPSMPKITLLPMIHIGEKEYFKEMSLEMWRHDTAFLEGCYMPARKLFHLFHRSISRFSELSLQSGRLPFWKKWRRESKVEGQSGLTEFIRKTGCDCGHCHYNEMRTIRADLHRWHALKAFKLIPLWLKLTFPIFILIAVIAAPFMNFREFVFDDDDDDLGDGTGFFGKLMAPFWRFVLDDRDLFLRMVLAEEVLRPRHKGKSLCVKFGAKHMPVLANTFLLDFGYRLADQREVLAVKKVKSMDVSNINTGYGFANEQYWKEFDAKQIRAKEVITKLVETDSENAIQVEIKEQFGTPSGTFTIQSNLSDLKDLVTPASAA